MTPPRRLDTVWQRIAWRYAQLACAETAIRAGRGGYVTVDYMVRAKLFAGLCEGRMSMRGLFDDERLKLIEHPCCVYCGSVAVLSIDHLIPRAGGGDADDAANLVRACRPCNSSKGARDLLAWLAARDAFPRLMLFRRYLKLVAARCDADAVLDLPPTDARLGGLPFVIDHLPVKLPPLAVLRL